MNSQGVKSGRLTGTPKGDHSPVVEWLKKNGLPVNRETYMEAAYPEGPPKPWTAEDEDGLPRSLQQWPNQ